MKFVEIYKLQNNGDQKVIAICKLTDEGVICEGEEVFVQNLKERGIRDYSQMGQGFALSGAGQLFPKDGIKFLENLKYAFKSAYLSATEVQDS